MTPGDQPSGQLRRGRCHRRRHQLSALLLVAWAAVLVLDISLTAATPTGPRSGSGGGYFADRRVVVDGDGRPSHGRRHQQPGHQQSSPSSSVNEDGEMVVEATTNCSSACSPRQVKRDYWLAMIKTEIPRKLRLGSLPNITGRQLPDIPPLRDIIGDSDMVSDSPFHVDGDGSDSDDDYHATTMKMMMFPTPVPDSLDPNTFHFRLNPEMRSHEIHKASVGIFIRRARQPLSNRTSFILFYQLAGPVPRRGSLPPRQLLMRTEIRLSGSDTGKWYHFNIRHLVRSWADNPSSNFGLLVEAWDDMGQSLPIVTPKDNNEEPFKPYLEIHVRDQSSSRSKRNLNLDCDEQSAERRCCRYPLVVDFDSFGWNWVIVPRRYSAYYCAGECPFVYYQQNPHAHIVQQHRQAAAVGSGGAGGSSRLHSPAATGGPCCSPRRVSSISMLYYDDDMNIIYGRLPGMVVDQCGCS